MYFHEEIVALVSFLLLALPALCTFSERVDAYAAEGVNLDRREQVYSVLGTSHQGETREEALHGTIPAKRPRVDQDQVLIQQSGGPLPIFVDKHAKMRQAHSKLMSELEVLEGYLNRADSQNLITYEKNVFRRLQNHIDGWFSGMFDEPIVPYEKRVISVVTRLKYSLDQVAAQTPTSMPLFTEPTARQKSLVKLELKLMIERMIFLTLKHLRDFQKIDEKQLSTFFSDLKTLKQLGYHIHDSYQLCRPSKFIPSVGYFIQDPLLEHLHSLLPAIPRFRMIILAHIVLSKTCQSFQQNDRLRLNLIHPNFSEFLNKLTSDEFLNVLNMPASLRSPFETNHTFQKIQMGKDFFIGEQVKASIQESGLRCKRKLGWNAENNAMLDMYLLVVEETESLLHRFLQSSLAQLESVSLEEQLRIENDCRNKLLSRNFLASQNPDERIAKLLFDTSYGTCQTRQAHWNFWSKPYPWETEELHSDQANSPA